MFIYGGDMRAAVITEPGGPEVFEIQELPDLSPGPDEVVVEIKATALNRADLAQRHGNYPAPAGIRDDIPGLEMSGLITEVGERVTGWSQGDRVIALLGGMGYATHVVVHERMLMPMPKTLSFEEAAGIPEVYLTAYDAMHLQCDLVMGESVLIHAAGSGVGTAAIQLAAAQSCLIFGTAGSDEKLAAASGLGLSYGVNYRNENFADVILDKTNGVGVDVVLDVIGAPYWDDNLRSLATLGRMVVVGSMGGNTLDNAKLGALGNKRATVRGTRLRSRTFEEKATVVQGFAKRVLPLFDRGVLGSIVDHVFPLEEVAAAHSYMESNTNFGKIILVNE